METTLNIHEVILAKITRLAENYKKSRTEIIIYLLKRVMRDMQNTPTMRRLIQYQKRNMPGDWATFHISFHPDDYEYFLDLRKLLKRSVSLILAYAVDKYLNDNITNNFTDKNPCKGYGIIKKTINNVIFWILIWGNPPKS